MDFDLDTPIEKILTDMLDKVEGHVGDCDCVNCNSLEVLAYMRCNICYVQWYMRTGTQSW